jgi:hypothetical protein
MARRYIPKNRNAVLVTRKTLNGKFRTETSGRDDDMLSVAVSTDPTTDNTKMFINCNDFGNTVRLSGAQARTIYRALQKHYQFVGKSW